MTGDHATQAHWDGSFAEQIAMAAYNTAPVEAVVRTVAYDLRERLQATSAAGLHFLELGCGAGSNLAWLAEKGLQVSGVDISPTALRLARQRLARAGHERRIGCLLQASVSRVPFDAASFDGIIEACVFQHLGREDRELAFREVARLLKPGGLFVGYMLDAGHTIYQRHRGEERPDDPGTLVLEQGQSRVYLSNLGVSHFFGRAEIERLLSGFAVVDPCLTTYYLPQHEARRRGYDAYLQSMWTVHAIR